MENLNNYQEVIDALKTKYVNARNLKKEAKTKQREVNNANSFLNRKNTEKEVLSDKLTSNRNLVEGTITNSFNNIEDSKFQVFNLQLNELRSDVASIDSQLDKLDRFKNIDPELYPDRTSTETQTLNLIRNMIGDAISSAEQTFNSIYNSNNYINIKTEVKPNMESGSSDQDIKNAYSILNGRFNELFESTKEIVDEFVNDYVQKSEESGYVKNQIYDRIRDINTLKSQLADLLDSQAPQSEIDQKETAIEDGKQSLISQSKDCKRLDAERESLYGTFQPKVMTYFDSLSELRDEMETYRGMNFEIVNDTFPNTREYVQDRMLELTDSFLEALNNISDFRVYDAGSDRNIFDELKNDLRVTGDIYVENRQMGQAMNFLNDLIDAPTNRLFENTQNSDGNYEWKFKKSVRESDKNNIIEYYQNLNSKFKPYSSLKAEIQFNEGKFDEGYWTLTELENKHLIYTSAFTTAIRNYEYIQRDTQNLWEGRYTGTEEQNNQFQQAFDVKIDAKLAFEYEKQQANIASFVSSRHNTIFSDFYSTFNDLLPNKDNTQNYFVSVDNERERLYTEANTAYDLLQSLYAGEAEYLTALGDYEAKNATFLSALTTLNDTYGVQKDAAYTVLQSAQIGEDQYQNAYDLFVNVTLPNWNNVDAPIVNALQAAALDAFHYRETFIEGTEEWIAADADYQTKNALFNAEFQPGGRRYAYDTANSNLQSLQDNEHIIFLGAQADYDAKVAEYDSFYNSIYNVTNLTGGDAVVYFYTNVLMPLLPTIFNGMSIGEPNFRFAVAEASILMQGGYEGTTVNFAGNPTFYDPSFRFTEEEFLAKKAEFSSAIASYGITFGNPSTMFGMEGQVYDAFILPSEGIQMPGTPGIMQIKNEAYAVLMDLTDEDATYQSALTDWNNKISTRDDWYNNNYVPALNARDEALIALQNCLGQMYYFNGIGRSGLELANIYYTHRDLQASISQNVKYNIWQEAESAYQNIKSQLTFTPSTPEEKLQARRDFMNTEHKKSQIKNWWNSKIDRHIEYLNNFTQSFMDSVYFLKQDHQQQLDYYLGQLIDFSADNQYNLRYRRQTNENWHNKMTWEAEMQKTYNKMLSQDMSDIGQVINVFAPDENAIQELRQNFSSFSSNMKSIFDEFIGNHSNSWFAEMAMNWAENGGEFNN